MVVRVNAFLERAIFFNVTYRLLKQFAYLFSTFMHCYIM